jgi:hypothetical protein
LGEYYIFGSNQFLITLVRCCHSFGCVGSVMALLLPSLLARLLPFVGKPPTYSTRLLFYPGETRPFYYWLRNFELEVPAYPADVLGSAAYDWPTLLTLVFDCEPPEEALDWAKFGLVETTNDLGVARDEAAKCTDATAAPIADTVESLEAVTQALMDSTRAEVNMSA